MHLADGVGLKLARLRVGPLEHFAGRLGHFCLYVGVEVSMAGPCSRDLRSRVLSAVEAGESVTATARRSAVGRSTAYRWVATARDAGRRDAKRMRGGPAPAIGGEVAAMVLSLAGGPNHLTLAEIAKRLTEATGVRVHQRNPARICA